MSKFGFDYMPGMAPKAQFARRKDQPQWSPQMPAGVAGCPHSGNAQPQQK